MKKILCVLMASLVLLGIAACTEPTDLCPPQVPDQSTWENPFLTYDQLDTLCLTYAGHMDVESRDSPYYCVCMACGGIPDNGPLDCSHD